MPWSTSSRRSRLPTDWTRRRRTVLERDGYLCQLRGNHCTVTANEVDHVIPTDDHSLTNLQAACRPCHRDKTQHESHAARPTRQRPAEPHPGLIQQG